MDKDVSLEMQAETPEQMPEEAPVTEAPQTSALTQILEKYYPGEVSEENKEELAVQAIEKLSGIQDNLIEVAESYPEFATFLNDVLKGMPVEEAVARNFDDMMTPPEGAPDWENINKGREERKTYLTEKKSRMELLEKNKQVSVENAQKLIEETGMSEEEAMKFLDWYDQLHADQFDGLVSLERFRALHKAYVFDTEMSNKDKKMQEEVETAKIAGKNEQLVQRKKNAETGDAIPKLGSSGAGAAKKGKPSYASQFINGAI